MSKIFIKPRKPEFIVFKPNGCRLKSEGEFWQRRLNDRDVVVAQPSKAAASSTDNKKGK